MLSILLVPIIMTIEGFVHHQSVFGKAIGSIDLGLVLSSVQTFAAMATFTLAYLAYRKFNAAQQIVNLQLKEVLKLCDLISTMKITLKIESSVSAKSCHFIFYIYDIMQTADNLKNNGLLEFGPGCTHVVDMKVMDLFVYLSSASSNPLLPSALAESVKRFRKVAFVSKKLHTIGSGNIAKWSFGAEAPKTSLQSSNTDDSLYLYSIDGEEISPEDLLNDIGEFYADLGEWLEKAAGGQKLNLELVKGGKEFSEVFKSDDSSSN